jgi:divalent metal cation (Fe/Co/Zn/Cd) transporter
MNKKEIKNLAKQIAKAESIIQNSTDQKERKYAMDTIIALSSKLSSLEEIERVDEMVQKILKNNS